MVWYLVLLPKHFEVRLFDGRNKSLTVRKGSIINSLNPSGLMSDWVGGSAPTRPSVESPSDLSVSKSSSLVEGDVADEFLSSLKVPRLF